MNNTMQKNETVTITIRELLTTYGIDILSSIPVAVKDYKAIGAPIASVVDHLNIALQAVNAIVFKYDELHMENDKLKAQLREAGLLKEEESKPDDLIEESELNIEEISEVEAPSDPE